jgi:hypothetical protein
MTLYKCDCGEDQKEIAKATIVLRDKKWVTKEALCKCGKYMSSKPKDGIPNLKRTEDSLSKTKRHDKMWDRAKERLVGERGVNDEY